jgi:tetratricopeptide (TPR) repeat protein
MMRGAGLFFLCLAAASTAMAQKPSPPLKPEEGPANYDLCLSTARSYPEQGFELAGRWEGLGGGEPAKHCSAVALIGLHQYAEAAQRLEALAKASKQPADVRAGMLAQAGQAWSLNGDKDRAYAAQSAALKLAPQGSPRSADILVDRAMTLADMGKYDDAVIDLSAALAIVPRDADALTFRASAYRALDKIDLALADAESAVAADGKNPDARLERGILYAAKGRAAAARQDWLAVVRIAPNSEAARAAKDDLARLDVKAGEPAPEPPDKPR